MSDCTRCGTIYKCPDCTPIRAEYARVARGALLTGMEDDAALLDAMRRTPPPGWPTPATPPIADAPDGMEHAAAHVASVFKLRPPACPACEGGGVVTDDGTWDDEHQCLTCGGTGRLAP